MKLFPCFHLQVAGLALCLGLGALSMNAFAVTPMVAAGAQHTVVLKSDGTVLA